MKICEFSNYCIYASDTVRYPNLLGITGWGIKNTDGIHGFYMDQNQLEFWDA